MCVGVAVAHGYTITTILSGDKGHRSLDTAPKSVLEKHYYQLRERMGRECSLLS